MSGEDRSPQTAYGMVQSQTYDQVRFTTSAGKLFHKMELAQLNTVLDNLSPNSRVLEIGCGTGRFMYELLHKGFEVVGLDASPHMLEESKARNSQFVNAKFVLAEGADIKFPAEAFDFVYSIRVLNQVESEEYALHMIREAVRVARKGGWILLEFVNKDGMSRPGKSRVRLNYKQVTQAAEHNGGARVQRFSGILFFPETLMKHTPKVLLPLFELADKAMASLFPKFCTRCYVILKKEQGV